MAGPHGSMADHGESHGHDDHSHGSTSLGPINTAAWAAGLGGILLGFAVAIALGLAGGSIHL
jgi:hypothetical protein